MKRIIFAFIVLLALFAAFVVLADRINKLFGVSNQKPRTSQAITAPPEHAG